MDSPTSFERTLDFIEENYLQNLPQVFEIIDKADFIAFDLEFSGCDYKPYFRSVYTDTFDTRYSKYRVDVENFYPIQLGICCFNFDEVSNTFVSRPMNFYVCPYAHRYHNPSLAIRASTLAFLREHHFQFGRLLSEGITTLRKSDEESIREYIRLSRSRYDFKDAQEKEFVEGVIHQVDKWVSQWNRLVESFDRSVPLVTSTSPHSDSDEHKLGASDCPCNKSPDTESPNKDSECDSIRDFLVLPPMSSHERKLLYQVINSKYPVLSLQELDEDNQDIQEEKTKRTRISVPRLTCKTVEQLIPDYEQHAGVRMVVERILQSNKPLIGFQSFGDLVYMLGGIYSELPVHLRDFIQFIDNHIKLLIDLKSILVIKSISDLQMEYDSLSKVYAKTGDWSYPSPAIRSALITGDKVAIHDAANDAYMTGCVFIRLLYRFGFTGNDIGKLPEMYHSLHHSPDQFSLMYHRYKVPFRDQFLVCMNKVHLYHMVSMMPIKVAEFDHIITHEASSCLERDRALFIEDIDPWLTTKMFRSYFQEYESTYFNWLDEQHLLIEFPSAVVADKVYSNWTLAQAAKLENGVGKTPPSGDFSERRLIFEDLKMSRFARYEELCFVGKKNVKHC